MDTARIDIQKEYITLSDVDKIISYYNLLATFITCVGQENSKNLNYFTRKTWETTQLMRLAFSIH